MPKVRKLVPEEVQQIENRGKGVRKRIEAQYDAYLSEFAVGDYGEAVPLPNENRLTVRNRLRAAASRRGLALAFRRTRGEAIQFKVLHDGTLEGVLPAEGERAAAPQRRRGPPRQAA